MLPLRGKILNIERARFDKMLSSDSIVILITALGTGIGREEFNADKLRYHKIIIMTDADVDGAHIRTLLLTFFYRQMPELIERGHIFIAQPPLYKAARGKSERYLKDEDGAAGLSDRRRRGRRVLHPAYRRDHGRRRSGRADRQCAHGGGGAERLPAPLSALRAGAGGDRRRAQSRNPVRRRQGGGSGALYRPAAGHAVARNIERGWHGEPTPRRRPEILARGARRARGGGDRRRPDRLAPMPAGWTAWRRNCRQTYLKSGTLRRKDETREIRSPSELLDAIFEWGRKGLALQRYKGLGEMNPEQLWETTLDENARSLLVVKVQHADEAGELFAKLMGDVVEPRREFIQDNALYAAVDI